ncbi:hypothetical protein C8F01DRAFT_1062724 [Mycena amicta]|nr:hypothetical protein C8F01DRAFT_1062724 [Mycena amicta]
MALPGTTNFKLLPILLTIGADAIPALGLYLTYLKRSFGRHVVESKSISPPDAALPLSASAPAGIKPLPAAVLNNPSAYVVARERITSHPFPRSSPRRELKTLASATMAYLRTTLLLFAGTPQARIMQRMMPSDSRPTFGREFITSCDFQPGDRVCGVYVVAQRVEGMVVLAMSPPEGWTGPKAEGNLVLGFIPDSDGVKGEEGLIHAVNETVLWRKTQDKPTIMEGAVGAWLHVLMVSWMVVRGVEAVTVRSK